MATVTLIPAFCNHGVRKKAEEVLKPRVSAYCPVSTDTDEQATRYDAQIEHYTDMIKKYVVHFRIRYDSFLHRICLP